MADDPSISLLSRQAIDAALSCNWKEAVEINSKILSAEPQNIDCLNRLAKAYLEQGQYNQAKKLYEEVLKLDVYNSIAQKNLKKVANCKKNGTDHKASNNSYTLSPYMFLHEPGVTKLVSLIKVAEPTKLLTLSNGMTVNLICKNRGITVTDYNNQYLGVLPDDISHLLLRLIKGGNKYLALVKSIKPNGLTILIREIYRAKKFHNQPSFIDESRVLTFASDHLTLFTEKMDGSSDEVVEEEIVNVV